MADIPVNESTAETVAVATTNGQTAFAFDFLCLWSEQMTVIHDRAGVETVLDYPAQFSVAGLNQENGGTVTLIGVDVLAGDVITMRRVTPIERVNDWQNEGDYKAALVNAEQDKLFMIMQELDRGIKEGGSATDKLGTEVVLLPDGHSGTQKLPEPSPGRVIGYGSDGSFRALANSAAEAEVIAVEVRAARDETVEAKDDAEAALTLTQMARDAAAGSASSASDDADRAELAAGNAFVNADVYADIATGRAAVADGEQFSVQVGLEYVRYERDSPTTEHEVGRFPAAEAVEKLQEIVVDEDLPTTDFAFTIRSDVGDVAFGVKSDGGVEVSEIDVGQVNGMSVGKIDALTEVAASQALAVSDDLGRVSIGVSTDGDTSIANLTTALVDGMSVRKITQADLGAGRYPSELTYFINSGQSLAVGPKPAETVVAEYDNRGFAQDAVSPTEFLPLQAPDCSEGLAEPPLFGALGHIKELILKENGLSYTDHTYNLAGADNSLQGATIAAIRKGTSYYSAGMSQITSAMTLAGAENKTFQMGAVFWTQGEADSGTSGTYYLDQVKLLAANYNTDAKAITGQTDDVHFIMYQMSTVASMAKAHLQASLDVPYIHVAAPIYPFEFSDAVHLKSIDTKRLGGYYGLAYKRIVVDELPWKPTRAISAAVTGAVIRAKFDVMVKPLVIDTLLVPEQVDYGFTLVDASNNPLTIESVEISDPTTVKIVAAASIPAGAKLRYAHNTAVGKGTYTGGCGNLRDSQGRIVEYYGYPMHNWCLTFEIAL